MFAVGSLWPIWNNIFRMEGKRIFRAEIREVGDYHNLFFRAKLPAAPHQYAFIIIEIDMNKFRVVDCQGVIGSAQVN